MSEPVWIVWGCYRHGVMEVVDEADSLEEAENLLTEYRLAYGEGWVLGICSAKDC